MLKTEFLTVGKLSPSRVAICSLTDRTQPQLTDDVRRALSAVDLDCVLTIGYLQPFLEERASLFDTTGTTERPDVLAAKLLEGRVGILMEGSPFALVVPRLLIESVQTLDDYSLKPWYATFLRWVKYVAILLSIFLPAFYVAVSIHHSELLDRTLLLLLTKAEANEPLSLPTEAIGTLLMYELIREAGLRLPKVVGGAVSIVGGLIIGDAAVSSGLVSTPMLTVTAIAVTSGFIVPDLTPALTILRLGCILIGGMFGLCGLSLCLTALCMELCRTEIFTYPLTAPLAPFTPKAMRDVAYRQGWKRMGKGGFAVGKLRK